MGNCFVVFCFVLSALFCSCRSHKESRSSGYDDIYQVEQAHYDPSLRDGNEQRKRYIERYSRAAIENRKQYGIPAAITLAQGILESASGTSYLAQMGLNHFGIKAGGDWSGQVISKPGESTRYRCYTTVAECFADHALFLKRKRYQPLFRKKVTDYKGWARGLSECGYATDPRYAEKLITIIERYELYKYDR